MAAEEKVIQFNAAGNGDARRSATNMGSDAAFTETFPWRPEGEGKAPIQMKVRPYVLSEADLEEIDRQAEETQAARQVLDEERSALVSRRGKLEAERRVEALLDDVDEGDSLIIGRIARIDERVGQIDAELEKMPTRFEIIAGLLVRVVASWPLTYLDDNGDEQVIPLDAKKIAKEIVPLKLTALKLDLQRFLYSDRFTRKRR